jgi:hypothetical protein
MTVPFQNYPHRHQPVRRASNRREVHLVIISEFALTSM